MSTLLSSPVTAAQLWQDLLLGTGGAGPLHGQRAQDRGHRPCACRRAAAGGKAGGRLLPRAGADAQHRGDRETPGRPNCANCTMRCGNTDNYDLARLWNALAEVHP